MLYFCTYFDRNYVARAVTLTHSLCKYHPGQFRLFAVCLDDVALSVMRGLAIPEVECITLAEIEQGDERLVATKSNRTRVEYYWTCTPTIILRILERCSFIDILTYIDADLDFFSGIKSLISEMGERAVLIHEHRYSAHLPFLGLGRFNVGLLCFKNNSKAREVLTDWRNDCINWCYERHEDGKYGDQAYLDKWPDRYSDICITNNPGAGVAPWNQDRYRIRNIFGQVHVDSHPLIFHHFSGVRQLNPSTFAPLRKRQFRFTHAHIENIYIPYLTELSRWRTELTKTFKGLPEAYDVGDFDRYSVITLLDNGYEVTPSDQLME
jgi:O-antigen biosynthesis protein